MGQNVNVCNLNVFDGCLLDNLNYTTSLFLYSRSIIGFTTPVTCLNVAIYRRKPVILSLFSCYTLHFTYWVWFGHTEYNRSCWPFRTTWTHPGFGGWEGSYNISFSFQCSGYRSIFVFNFFFVGHGLVCLLILLLCLLLWYHRILFQFHVSSIPCLTGFLAFVLVNYHNLKLFISLLIWFLMNVLDTCTAYRKL